MASWQMEIQLDQGLITPGLGEIFHLRSLESGRKVRMEEEEHWTGMGVDALRRDLTTSETSDEQRTRLLELRNTITCAADTTTTIPLESDTDGLARLIKILWLVSRGDHKIARELIASSQIRMAGAPTEQAAAKSESNRKKKKDNNEKKKPVNGSKGRAKKGTPKKGKSEITSEAVPEIQTSGHKGRNAKKKLKMKGRNAKKKLKLAGYESAETETTPQSHTIDVDPSIETYTASPDAGDRAGKRKRKKKAKSGDAKWRTAMIPPSLLEALGIGATLQTPLHGVTRTVRPPSDARKHLGQTAIPQPKRLPDGLLPISTHHLKTCNPGGIPSTTFAKVLRLIAGFSPPQCRHVPSRDFKPKHRPPVWAESRQELCEALPYYRAFQSGLYMFRKVAFGYLLEAFPAPRDTWAQHGRVIISHGGGQCVQPQDACGAQVGAPPVLSADQSPTDARIATLLRAAERRVPLVLIAGAGYDKLPWRLDCAYAVLGWYWVSLVWTEAEPAAYGIAPPGDRDYFQRVKVRFEWVDTQGAPWWEDKAGPVRVKSENPAAPSSSVSEPLVPLSALPPSPSTAEYVTAALPPDANAAKAVETVVLPPTPPLTPHLPKVMSVLQMLNPVEVPSVSVRQETSAQSDISNCQPMTDLPTPPTTPQEATFPLSLDEGLSLSTPNSHLHPSRASRSPDGAPKPKPNRRLPGEYRLNSFERIATSDDYTDPFIHIRNICPTCQTPSPQIYSEGWICLTTTCKAYWLLNTRIGLLPIPPGFNLTYLDAFLSCVPTPKGTEAPYNVVPPCPASSEHSDTGDVGTRALWKGWVCDECGRANCRFRWEVWECLGCHRLLAPLSGSATVPALELCPPYPAVLGSAVIHPDSGIIVMSKRLVNSKASVMIYHLPNGSGTIYHVLHDDAQRADEILEAYQRQAADTAVPLFQRRALKANTVKGQLLAQHFAVNSGASYKYNVDSLSLTFTDSPPCVVSALEAITQRVGQVLNERIGFNEILSVLYREGQKMSWHDDGEDGLGPVVASLSLGSSATMSWRPKIIRPKAYDTYRGVEPAARIMANPTALSLTLSHGDMVIMQGRQMQERYSHRVIPLGFRVAATARVIGAEPGVRVCEEVQSQASLGS